VVGRRVRGEVSERFAAPLVESSVDDPVMVHRVAGLDIGKSGLVACLRVPDPRHPERRRVETREFSTLSTGLLGLVDWLEVERVELTVMEATSDYWKPVYYLLEAEGLGCWLVNPKQVKNVPGRPKTDKLDAQWLARLAEKGMCSPSLVHPKPIRQLRDLTRYRRSLVRERTREKQRVEKLLEEAQIKLSSVISDVFGVSGRAMLEAMIAGQSDPAKLAELARGSMRGKRVELIEALTGHFEAAHHGFIAAKMLHRIDELTADIDELTGRIEEQIAPFQAQVNALDQIPGIGPLAAQDLIAEIGVDMSVFPSPKHLAAWAKFAPVDRESAGKRKAGTTGKGNGWLAGVLGEAVTGAARTDTYLGARYHRLARRRGKRRAIVAVGNTMLKQIWVLLNDPTRPYQELGSDYFDHEINTRRRQRNLIRELERLTGQQVVLNPIPNQVA
jgi:transposase